MLQSASIFLPELTSGNTPFSIPTLWRVKGDVKKTKAYLSKLPEPEGLGGAVTNILSVTAREGETNRW